MEHNLAAVVVHLNFMTALERNKPDFDKLGPIPATIWSLAQILILLSNLRLAFERQECRLEDATLI